LTQKGNIPEMKILDNQGKDKKVTIIKIKEDRSSSSPEKSTTEEVGKKLSTEIETPLRLSHHYSLPEETLIQRQSS
jgi:hypothetical protein